MITILFDRFGSVCKAYNQVYSSSAYMYGHSKQLYNKKYRQTIIILTS